MKLLPLMRRRACEVTKRSVGWGLASTAVLVLGMLHFLSSNALAMAGFVFSTPPGWLNISPDASETERRRAPAELLALVSSGPFAFYAVDLDTNAYISAIVSAGQPPRVTPLFLDQLQQMVKRDVDAQGLTYLPVKRELAKVAGVAAALLVGDIRTPDATMRTAQYAVPGEGALAFITFSAPSEKFEASRPAFEASLQALQGAREATDGGSAASMRAPGVMTVMGLSSGAFSLVVSLPLFFHPVSRRLAWRILGVGVALIMTAAFAHFVGRAIRETDVAREKPSLGASQQDWAAPLVTAAG